MSGDGILSEPLDIDAPRQRGLSHKKLFVRPGMVLRYRGDGTVGAVIKFQEGDFVVLRNGSGQDIRFTAVDGMFEYEDVPVALRQPTDPVAPKAPQRTASGSVDVGETPARMARASRIWVEGIHDAELIERVWGDDLRWEGVVVEQLEGADDLEARVRTFGPRDGRRLGILLDHMVSGSKESRIAATINHPDVLILGHPYVDVWEAVKPSAIGIEAWPQIPKGQPWKEGILHALGVTTHPAQFWKHLLGQVDSWTDLETPLVTSVEQLIDFVTV